MRLTFLNTLYSPYGAAGAETTLRLLAAQMMGRGHDCNVVTLTPGRQAETREIDDFFGGLDDLAAPPR